MRAMFAGNLNLAAAEKLEGFHLAVNTCIGMVTENDMLKCLGATGLPLHSPQEMVQKQLEEDDMGCLSAVLAAYVDCRTPAQVLISGSCHTGLYRASRRTAVQADWVSRKQIPNMAVLGLNAFVRAKEIPSKSDWHMDPLAMMNDPEDWQASVSGMLGRVSDHRAL